MGSVRLKAKRKEELIRASTWRGSLAKTGKSIQLQLIGSPNTGKSCMIFRFINDKFVEDYEPTLKDTFKQDYKIDGETVMLHLHDNSSLEDVGALRQVDGFICVYAINDAKSFQDILNSYYHLTKQLKSLTPFILVGNKADLKSAREVSYERGLAAAKSMNALFFETSCRSGFNVEKSFVQLLKEIAFIKSGGATHQDKQSNESSKELKNSSVDKQRAKTLNEKERDCVII